MPRLAVIIASSRPGRTALPVSRWFIPVAKRHPAFEVDVVDLAEVNLPFLDEPNHPRLHKYEHEHTKAWSARVDAADAFVIITPEYNYGMPAILKNAIDYLNQEWQYKPVGFVSYGGVSAGTRSVQMTKQVISALSMFPIVTTVSIPFVKQLIENGELIPNDIMSGAAQDMLDELATMEQTLRPLREQP